jgi:hypothetical protein
VCGKAAFLDCRFPGTSFKHALAQLPHVRTLNISGSRFEDPDLTNLTNLRHLESLEVFDISIPLDLLSSAPWMNLKQLKLLVISPNRTIQLSGEDLDAISKMESLEELCIVGRPGLTVDDLSQ